MWSWRIYCIGSKRCTVGCLGGFHKVLLRKGQPKTELITARYQRQPNLESRALKIL